MSTIYLVNEQTFPVQLSPEIRSQVTIDSACRREVIAALSAIPPTAPQSISAHWFWPHAAHSWPDRFCRRAVCRCQSPPGPRSRRHARRTISSVEWTPPHGRARRVWRSQQTCRTWGHTDRGGTQSGQFVLLGLFVCRQLGSDVECDMWAWAQVLLKADIANVRRKRVPIASVVPWNVG